jgi:hypothetical protein
MSNDAPLRFIVEPRLLDHFGIGMYNTVEKALAELAANAYDADAARVDVKVTANKLTVRDNGLGMTPKQVQDRYLRLGRDRRVADGGEKTKLGRPVIGNKGIGKLAGLGIAKTMIVTTVRDGQKTTLRIEREELDRRDSLEQVDLHPKISVAKAGEVGTQVSLEALLDDATAVDTAKLREHLATEMPSVPNFDVYVNGKKATPEDIPGQYFPISADIPGFGHVGGFYKLVKKRSMDVAPGLAVRIRERIVQPRSLFGLNQQTHGFFVVTRIVGELWPDFIDPLDKRDAVDAFAINTSRTGLNAESRKVQALTKFAREYLKTIADGEESKRKARRKAAALKRHPDLEVRLQRLAPEVYRKLDSSIDRVIEILAKNEKRETVDEIVDIVVRYYESDALKALVESIKGHQDADIKRLAELLSQFGSQRIFDLANLLWFQLAVIQALEDKVREQALEAEIHRIVASNIWLVRETLQYWFDNKTFSTQLKDALVDEFKWAKKQRPDLVCYDNHKVHGDSGKADQLVVVEFKKPGVEIGYEQVAQVMAYKNVFGASLAGFGADNIEVWILADKFSNKIDRPALRAAGYYLLSYVELLEAARGRYRSFYEQLVPDGKAPPHPDIVLTADDADEDVDDDEVDGSLVEPGQVPL